MSTAVRFEGFFFLILEVEGKCIKQARLHNSVICLITTRSSNWVMRRVVRSNCNACLYLVYKFTMPTVITCSIRRESAWPGRKKKSWKTKGSLPFVCYPNTQQNFWGHISIYLEAIQTTFIRSHNAHQQPQTEIPNSRVLIYEFLCHLQKCGVMFFTTIYMYNVYIYNSKMWRI